MKRENLGWLVAGVVIALAATMGAVQSAGQPGRWCLYELDTATTIGGTRTPDVFLLDTSTGNSWVLDKYFWINLETSSEQYPPGDYRRYLPKQPSK